MRRFARSMGNILLTILVILLIVYGWAFIEMKLLLKSQPELFGFVFYQQQEEDMTPEFNAKDVIVVKKDAAYQKGDIILYFDSKDSKYKAHYVVSNTSDTIITKCATCSSNNDPISTNNVVGKAIGKVLFMGAIISFFKQKIVLILIGVMGITFLVISQYMEFKPKKKDEENTHEDSQEESDEKNVANDNIN